MITVQRVAGVVHAGGRSSRMGADKALIVLAGQPLIFHVVARFRPQVERLFVNANGDTTRFGALGLPVVSDAPDRKHTGPLAGIRAALAYASQLGFPLLATVPCDTPLLPPDLVAKLAPAMRAAGGPVVVAASPRGLEPMFALWRTETVDALDEALGCGEVSPRRLMERLGAVRVLFQDTAGDDDCFTNLNTPEELTAARARLSGAS